MDWSVFGELVIYLPLAVLALGVWALNSHRNSGDQWDEYHK
jgi:hypothetical protein